MSDTLTEASAGSDEILLDVATIIELSPRDRRVAENRYRLLKEHLERSTSPLRSYLEASDGKIYAQGSIATSTTIVDGVDDDRFDVDAVVEMDVPPEWTNDQALDLLEEALQGFPGATAIVRCTRCVQIQFPFMHMDVAIMDRRQRLAIERAGEIFHSPDSGRSYRVPSNPWGFTSWFRASLAYEQVEFAKRLNDRRTSRSRDRLVVLDSYENLVLAKADQEALPPAIPPRVDAQEAVALKLMKRAINVAYCRAGIKKPPSVYLTKKTGDFSYVPSGLTDQLIGLCQYIAREMDTHLEAGTTPTEVNPSYPPDKINDRWPTARADMERLSKTLHHIAEQLTIAKMAPLNDVLAIVEDLFGERVGKEQRAILKDRYDRRADKKPIKYERGTGAIVAPGLAAPATVTSAIKEHSFHPGIIEGNKGGPQK